MGGLETIYLGVSRANLPVLERKLKSAVISFHDGQGTALIYYSLLEMSNVPNMPFLSHRVSVYSWKGAPGILKFGNASSCTFRLNSIDRFER